MRKSFQTTDHQDAYLAQINTQPCCVITFAVHCLWNAYVLRSALIRDKNVIVSPKGKIHFYVIIFPETSQINFIIYKSLEIRLIFYKMQGMSFRFRGGFLMDRERKDMLNRHHFKVYCRHNRK